jgi:hypothetical protein
LARAAHLPTGAEGLPCPAPPGIVHDPTGLLDLRFHIRQHELDVLQPADRLPVQDPLPGETESNIEGAFCDSKPDGPDNRTGNDEAGQRNGMPVAFPANQVIRGDPAVLEKEFADRNGAEPRLTFPSPDPEAGRFLFHGQHAGAVSRSDEKEADIRDAAVGDVDLAAPNPERVSLPHGLRAEVGHVRSPVGSVPPGRRSSGPG